MKLERPTLEPPPMPQYQPGAQTPQNDHRLHPCSHRTQVGAIRVERRSAFGQQRGNPTFPLGDPTDQSRGRFVSPGSLARDRFAETAACQALPVAQPPAAEVKPDLVKLSPEAGDHGC